MSGPSPRDVLGRITLVTGKEDLLSDRAVAAVKAAVRRADPDAEDADTVAGDLSPGTLAELAAPSLFSVTRCVVVRGLEGLPDDCVEGLLAYAAAPADDVAVVLVHGGGARGSGLLAKLRKCDVVTEVKSTELKPSELPRFITNEVASQGASIDDRAAWLLVQAVGHDLRALAAAASQLASDFPDGQLTEEIVRRYFAGRAEVKSFAVADAALAGRAATALEQLRWANDAGTPPVLITSAFAAGVRGLGRYLTAPRGMREADLAREVGVPPWKLRSIRDQSRGWDHAGVGQALRVIAETDAGIKGAAADPEQALERLVLTIAGLRTDAG